MWSVDSHIDLCNDYCGTSKLWTLWDRLIFAVIDFKLYCHSPVGTTELVLYREVKCTVFFIRSKCPLREIPLYILYIT